VAFGTSCVGCSGPAEPPPGYLGGDAAFFMPPPHEAGVSDGAGEAGDGGGSDADAAAWAGTWKYTSGSQGNLCGGTLAVIATEGVLDITPSASGTLLTVVEDGCHFVFDLAGDVATEEPDQPCAAWAITTIPIWTLTMQPDGTLLEKIGGQVDEGGELCTLSGGATLVRQ